MAQTRRRALPRHWTRPLNSAAQWRHWHPHRRLQSEAHPAGDRASWRRRRAVQKLNRTLYEAGIFVMRDHPQGKRYGRRDKRGRIIEA
jgi:Replication protein C N-terminal domain